MSLRSFGIPGTLLALAVSVANSCGEDACACTPAETLVGTYNATRLRFTPSGQATVDALAAGATITLTLSGSGATSGTPGVATPGTAVAAASVAAPPRAMRARGNTAGAASTAAAGAGQKRGAVSAPMSERAYWPSKPTDANAASQKSDEYKDEKKP